MTDLRYIGPLPEDVGVVPLPQGWPAADHIDNDEERVIEKLESGNYEVVDGAPDEAVEPSDDTSTPPGAGLEDSAGDSDAPPPDDDS